jgi:GxxExxY protein
MENQSREILNGISAKVLDSAFAVHREIGPGMFESIYQECLTHEFKERGLKFETSVTVPVTYKAVKLKKRFVIDLLVEDHIVVELKSVEDLMPVHHTQLLSYLKLTGKKLGVLINFNEKFLKDGIVRIVNNF